MRLTKRAYRWFYDHVQCRYYDLLIRWCFLPFGGEKQLRTRLLQPISLCRDDAILDIGCGTGSATFALAEKAGDEAEIVGLDLSIGQLRRARARSRFANVDFVQSDATRTGFRDHCFDRVFITHTLHEVQRRDRLAALLEARRMLKPGGTLAVLELDDPKSLGVRLFVGLWFFYWLPLNFETATRQDMLRCGLDNEVRQAGFDEVRKTSFCHGVFQVVQGRRKPAL